MSSQTDVVDVAMPDRRLPEPDDTADGDDGIPRPGTSQRPRRRQVRQDADGRLIFRL